MYGFILFTVFGVGCFSGAVFSYLYLGRLKEQVEDNSKWIEAHSSLEQLATALDYQNSN